MSMMETPPSGSTPPRVRGVACGAVLDDYLPGCSSADFCRRWQRRCCERAVARGVSLRVPGIRRAK